MIIDRTENKKRYDASERHWGIWYLSKSEPLSLNVYPYPNNSPYEIELDRLDNPNKILAWINHFIESKEYVTEEDIRDFLKACNVLIEEGLIKMPHVYKQRELSDAHWGY